MAQLYIIHEGRRETVAIGQELTIGRSYSNRLRLEGADVSRAHAVIHRRGEEYHLYDLDSRNGVRVNGKHAKKYLLKPGDQVLIGKYLMIFDPPNPETLDPVSDEPAPSKEESGKNTTQPQAPYFYFPVSDLEAGFTMSPSDARGNQDVASEDLCFAYRLFDSFGTSSQFRDVSAKALDVARTVMLVQSGAVILRDKPDSEPEAAAVFDEERKGQVNILASHIRCLLDEGRAFLFSGCDAMESDGGLETRDADVQQKEWTNRVAVPMFIHGAMGGFIYLENTRPNAEYTLDDVRRLYLIGMALARKLEQGERFEQA